MGEISYIFNQEVLIGFPRKETTLLLRLFLAQLQLTYCSISLLHPPLLARDINDFKVPL
jgi:hypothetical protein